MKIVNLYPTPLGEFQLKDCNTLNKGLTDFIYDIKKENNSQRSMVGGYHTKENLLSSENNFIKEFHNIISEKILKYYSYINNISPGPNTKMVSWAMIYGAGHYSKPHSHPLADISSAYYCKVPIELSEEDGNFVHMDPRPNANWDLNFTHNSTQLIKVKEGMGIIFPGWLKHYVVPHNSKQDRICISTNVFIDHGTFF